jgi:hypothetical protein
MGSPPWSISGLNFLTSLPKPGRNWPLLILHNLRQDGINPSLPSRFWFIGDRAHAQAQAMPLMTDGGRDNST